MNPHNLTPELVALIERDATERYGHRMRLVLESNPEPDPQPKKAPEKRLKPPPKVVVKPTRAKPQKNPQEVNQDILERARHPLGIRARDITDLESNPDRRTDLLNALVEAGDLTKSGNGPGMRYFTVVADSSTEESESEEEDNEEKGGRE